MLHLKRTICPLLVLATLAFAGAAQATTYFVDRTLPGSNSNNGTSESTPLLTIPKCVAMAVNPGDTCLVKNGTYPEGITMSRSGTNGSPITLKNYPGHSPHLLFADRTNSVNRIHLDGGSGTARINYVTIEGLHIENAYNGVKFECASNIVIKDNRIHDTLFAAILGRGTRITITQNTIYHTGDFSDSAHTHGIYLTGQYYTITNNIIYDTNLYGMHLAAYPYDAAKDPSTDYAGFGNSLVSGNTIAYTFSGGAVLWNAGAGNAFMQNNIFENNLCLQNSRRGRELFTCLTGLGGGFTAIVRNNLCWQTSPRPTDCFHLSFAVTGTMTSNPNLVNAPETLPASPNFHLKATSSAAIDRGSLSGYVTVDIDGKPRPREAGYDIGAYEFFSSDDSAPFTPTNLMVQ